MVLIASTADAAQAKPILHIECCCTYTGVKISRSIVCHEVLLVNGTWSNELRIPQLVKDIDNWLRRNFVSVELKQTFTSFRESSCKSTLLCCNLANRFAFKLGSVIRNTLSSLL